MGLFKRINLALSRRIHWRLPNALTEPLFPEYERLIWQFTSGLENGVIVDVGAGYLLPDSLKCERSPDVTLIGMDILPSSLEKNTDIDAAVIADACKPWPFEDNSIDVVFSRSVMEHLYDNETFVSEMHRTLKPGGICIHVLPGKHAPFSILNRLLPNKVTKKLVEWAFPERKGELGFVAYYHHCSPPALQRLFERNGFTIEYERLRYYQSAYYVSVFPVFLLSAGYDWLMWKLGTIRLASQILIVAKKPVITENQPERVE